MSWIGIAVRELVRLAENIAVFIEQHGFGGSRAAVDSNEAADGRVLLEGCRSEFLAAVGSFEGVQFRDIFDQAPRARFGLFFLAAVFDVVDQLIVATVAANAIFFALAEFNRAHRGEILRVLRDFDQFLGLCALGNCDFALLPHARNVGLPGFAHAAHKAVGAAEQ